MRIKSDGDDGDFLMNEEKTMFQKGSKYVVAYHVNEECLLNTHQEDLWSHLHRFQ